MRRGAMSSTREMPNGVLREDPFLALFVGPGVSAVGIRCCIGRDDQRFDCWHGSVGGLGRFRGLAFFFVAAGREAAAASIRKMTRSLFMIDLSFFMFLLFDPAAERAERAWA